MYEMNEKRMLNSKSTIILLLFIAFLSSLPAIHANKQCPLSSKCPYYKAYHSGTDLKNYNWDEPNCPAANKCRKDHN